MLTHHQYTYIQKEQNIAVSSNQKSTRPHVFILQRPAELLKARASLFQCGNRPPPHEAGQSEIIVPPSTKLCVLKTARIVEKQHTSDNLCFNRRPESTLQSPHFLSNKSHLTDDLKSNGYFSKQPARPKAPRLAGTELPPENQTRDREQSPPQTLDASDLDLFCEDPFDDPLPQLARSLTANLYGCFNNPRPPKKKLSGPCRCGLEPQVRCVEGCRLRSSLPQKSDWLARLRRQDWMLMPQEEFLSIAVGSSSRSAYLLNLIKRTRPISPCLVDLVLSSMDLLTRHCFGWHYLKAVAAENSQALVRVQQHTLNNFVELSSDRHCSELMQVLSSLDPDYRERCLDLFLVNYRILVPHMPAVLLLAVCLAKTDPTSTPFVRIGRCLLQRASYLVEDRYDKRVLALYLDHCGSEELHVFFRILRFRLDFAARFDDKYMVYIFRLLLRREHKESEQLLLDNLKTASLRVLDRKKLFQEFLRDMTSQEAGQQLTGFQLTVKSTYASTLNKKLEKNRVDV